MFTNSPPPVSINLRVEVSWNALGRPFSKAVAVQFRVAVSVFSKTFASPKEAVGRNRCVVVVSSGDPGVFAMAAALFEALEPRPDPQAYDIEILPGITAMLAAAARLGAPLGHDFCAINLSDNLKPWDLIEKRLRLAGQAGFAMAFYNPRSASRPGRFERVLEILREACGPDTLISFARAVTTPDERLLTVTLTEATPDMADMRTMVIVGNADTRRIGRFIYSPRHAG